MDKLSEHGIKLIFGIRINIKLAQLYRIYLRDDNALQPKTQSIKLSR